MDVKKFEFLKTVAFQKGREWGVGGGGNIMLSLSSSRLILHHQLTFYLFMVALP